MPTAEGAPLLVLIDASSFIFRAYHAIQHLSTSKGVPTNAVYGFTRMLLKTLRELSPTHVALAFDKESRTGRQEIDPTYKANREAPPSDLLPQFELIRRVIEVLNVPVLEVRGWEADDVIGTLVVKAKQKGFHVLVVTGDKDFVQLVDDEVRLFDPMTDRHTGPREVEERLGILPSQMRDYLALVGDPIDNVAKVPGIGPKTAAELLKQFGNVESLLERLNEVAKPKTREALREHREGVLRAKQLVSFRLDLDIDADVEDFVRQPIHEAQARDLFSELEFFKLLQEMPTPPPTPLPQRTAVVTKLEDLRTLVQQAREAKELTLIPAYQGLAHSAECIGLGVALPGGRTFYVPMAHRGFAAGEQVALADLVAELGPVLAAPEIRKTGHNVKALWLLLSNVGISLEGIAADVELLSYLLNPSRREHALQDLARERLRVEVPMMPAAAMGKKGDRLEQLAADEVAAYYGAAAEAARRLADELWPEIERCALAPLARDIELPLIPVLGRMERAGVKLDATVLKTISTQVDRQCNEKLAEIHVLAGRELNVGSNAQLAQVLYTELKLPVLKRGKTGPSTDQEVLEKLAEQHPIAKAITDHRALAKLKSTYLDTLPLLVGKDGRVHTTFHQAAATGRLSSSDPNLQNIPIRSELGREIRGAFTAEPGSKLISADYSQIELRLLAHIAEDPVLIDAFLNDADIHTRTAAEVFGVKPEEVTANQRRAAKAVNFGIAYGLSPHGLAIRLDISNDEARVIIEKYFERYSGIRRYLDQTVEKARKLGYVETLYGRRRYIPELNSRNRNAAQAAERAAINMPIQGTAADLIKIAMVRIDRALSEQKLQTRMLLQVHDELLVESPESELARASTLVSEIMSGVAQLKVPLKVDVGIASSWAEAH